MNDEQIEAALRRYRIAPPSPDVKARVLAHSGCPPSVELTAWDWGMVAAAAILVTVSMATDAGPHAAVSGAEAAWMADVEATAALLGGGSTATRIAEMSIPRPTLFESESEEE